MGALPPLQGPEQTNLGYLLWVLEKCYRARARKLEKVVLEERWILFLQGSAMLRILHFRGRTDVLGA